MRWILVVACLSSGCAAIRAATNHPPSRQQLGQLTPEEIEADRQARAGFARGLAEATKPKPTMRCTPDPYRKGELICVPE